MDLEEKILPVTDKLFSTVHICLIDKNNNVCEIKYFHTVNF